jgi:AcrR family transcriptional regulator
MTNSTEGLVVGHGSGSASGNAPRTARERARAEVTAEIKRVARDQLAAEGASALSLRAVALEVGLVSSAVYRYFPSRDELLTALIIDAYTSVGERATEAEADVRRSDLMGRWLAVARAVRDWARGNPHEYGLIFGTPVPGYAAPRDTVDPAAVVPQLLLRILGESVAEGRAVAWRDRPIPRAVRSDLRALRTQAQLALDDDQLVQAIMAWTQLIGVISFELFGHLQNVIGETDAYFDHQMRNVGRDLGFA